MKNAYKMLPARAHVDAGLSWNSRRVGWSRCAVGAVGLGLLALSGCSTLAEYGIGGPPRLMCGTDGLAALDDRIVGPDAARLSLVRRFADGDKLCK